MAGWCPASGDGPGRVSTAQPWAALLAMEESCTSARPASPHAPAPSQFSLEPGGARNLLALTVLGQWLLARAGEGKSSRA